METTLIRKHKHEFMYDDSGGFSPCGICGAPYSITPSPAAPPEDKDATISRQAAQISEMTAVLRQYRDFHKKGRRPCIESATCSTCQEAEPFLAPDQPKGETP